MQRPARRCSWCLLASRSSVHQRSWKRGSTANRSPSCVAQPDPRMPRLPRRSSSSRRERSKWAQDRHGLAQPWIRCRCRGLWRRVLEGSRNYTDHGESTVAFLALTDKWFRRERRRPGSLQWASSGGAQQLHASTCDPRMARDLDSDGASPGALSDGA